MESFIATISKPEPCSSVAGACGSQKSCACNKNASNKNEVKIKSLVQKIAIPYSFQSFQILWCFKGMNVT